jgi:uncharacterized membrane protein
MLERQLTSPDLTSPDTPTAPPGPVDEAAGRPRPAGLPWSLLLAVGLVTALELVLAWTTAGTYDITIFRSFADTVARVGPVRIYGLDEAGLMVYNHPPLVGWWLSVVGWLASHGLPFGFVIRFPSVLAHIASVYLVFDMLARRAAGRAGRRRALVAGFGVALSPLLIIIAGYHGNNDPVVAALVLASAWLLVDRRAPVWAGLAFSLAVSVKIIPLVVLPILLVAAWALGRRDALRFVLGGIPVFVLLWGPALVLATMGYLRHVMAYNGSGFPRVWGPYQLLKGIGAPELLLDLYVRPGTYALVLVCALLPAWVIRHTPQRLPAAVALALTGFVLLSPGWATQYLAWIAAAVFLLDLWPALLFTLGAGTAYLVLYLQWDGDVRPPEAYQLPIIFIAWLVLVPVVVFGWRRLRNPEADRIAV